MCVWMWLSLCEIVILSVTVKNSLHSRKAAGPSQPQTNHPQITYHLSQRLPDLCLTCVLGLRKGCYYSTWYENDSLMSFKERCNSVTWWRWLPQVLSRRRDRERERERERESIKSLVPLEKCCDSAHRMLHCVDSWKTVIGVFIRALQEAKKE